MNGISVEESKTVNTSLIAVSFGPPVMVAQNLEILHRRRLIREHHSYTSRNP